MKTTGIWQLNPRAMEKYISLLYYFKSVVLGDGDRPVQDCKSTNECDGNEEDTHESNKEIDLGMDELQREHIPDLQLRGERFFVPIDLDNSNKEGERRVADNTDVPSFTMPKLFEFFCVIRLTYR